MRAESSGAPVAALRALRSASARWIASAALAVVLLRLRIAEQRHQAVAELLQHVAAERSHGGRGGVEVTAHQIAPVLGIELRREARRADEVAKHDRDWTTLGGCGRTGGRWRGRGHGTGHCWRWRDRGRGRYVRTVAGEAQSSNAVEQPATVTDGDNTDLLQVVGRQLGQHRAIDCVIAERRLILP